MDDEARDDRPRPRCLTGTPEGGPGGAGGRRIGHPRARRARAGRMLAGPTYAALDLGTNNCRLLVARADRATASA